ncbi:MAG: Wzz/FepE/Etk N-terminal domain-containing protein [Actinomycetia bacterium]|nr:Wzz/FepE/Etk N-terminal domain-containing protein [Actinomycetes bacterium]
MSYDIDILYYFNIVKKYRKKIFFFMIIAVAIALISGLLKRPVYTSRCTILLQESSPGPSLSNLSKFMGFPGFTFNTSSANTIISIVKSRRMMEDIYLNFGELKKKSGFDLKIEVYDTTQGTLIIDVKGREPKLVSDIANFCAKNLDAINAELDLTMQRPMVKILDSAIPALGPDSRHIVQRISIAAIFTFLTVNFIFFGIEYYSLLVNRKK